MFNVKGENIMKNRSKITGCLIVFLFSALFFCFNIAVADTIVFKDGTKMEVKIAWQEGNVVKTERYGGIVSFPMSKVDRIVKGEYNYLEENKKPEPELPKDRVGEIPEFLQIKAFSTKIVESSDDYVYVSWTARMDSEKACKVMLSICFYDNEGNVVDKDLEEAQLGLGTNSAADMTMIKGSIYKKVSSSGINVKELE
jgi:hypothetical protein